MNVIVAVLAIVATADVAQRQSQLRAWTTARRATAGGALVVAAGALGAAAARLLDALDISRPTIQIAAGMLVVLWAVWQFFTWDPDEAPGAVVGGLVPGFFPLLFTPPLGVLLLAAGADHGMALPIAGALVVAALLAAPPIALGYRALRRVTASIALVCGVALMVGGVMAI